MRSNYKKLGSYIREVKDKNTDLETELLLGVSITKEFIPSIANTIGTDMSKYLKVKKGQFAYGPVTSRNGDKISVALLSEHDACIISSSYKVFEVIDETELLPEYLMMWFRRPEFDRYARFMSHGSTRETFDWAEMCDLELPIPPLNKQQEIVNEYHTIVNRIKLNEQLNEKLEETAQTLYKHWFVDFEFPDENGKPYKSSGGKMIYNEELDKKIPEGWNVTRLGNLIDYVKGYAFKSDLYSEVGHPVVRVSDLSKRSINFENCYKIDFDLSKNYENVSILENDIIITSVGSWASNPDSVVGKVVKAPYVESYALLNQNMVKIRAKIKLSQIILFQSLIRKEFSDFIISGAQGSANQASVTLDHIFSYQLCYPNENMLAKLSHNFADVASITSVYTRQNWKLSILKNILLSKMTKVELEKTTF